MRRITLAMSQQKLGDALGLTFQQIQKYEKGSNRKVRVGCTKSRTFSKSRLSFSSRTRRNCQVL
jgi:Helix-turn-helix